MIQKYFDKFRRKLFFISVLMKICDAFLYEKAWKSDGMPHENEISKKSKNEWKFLFSLYLFISIHFKS